MDGVITPGKQTRGHAGKEKVLKINDLKNIRVS